MSVHSGAALVDALRQYQVLEPVQLQEVVQHLHARCGEPRALARELLQRGWLTPYQVNQLLLGRGAELLFDQYVVLARLGQGGTGQVFKARHRRLKRLVALKVVRPDLQSDPEVISRFHREIQIVSQLDHPNVVHAYDAGTIGPIIFLAMEYVEGTDLAGLVKKGGPLPLAQAADFIRQAALGLQHAHENRLVHRDIKPPNLMVSGGVVSGEWSDKLSHCTTGHSPLTTHHSPLTTHHSPLTTPPLTTHQIKILDLGLARLQRTSIDGEMTSFLTPAGPAMMGTPDYMAPEQAIEFHQADIRADIYSLGCTFYYLLASQPPFPGGSLAQKLLRHQQATPPPLERFRPDVPPRLAAVLGRMLAKEPAERFQAPAEVAGALQTLLQAGLSSAAPPARPAGASTQPLTVSLPAAPKPAVATTEQRRRRIRIAIAAGGALLLGLGLLLVAVLVWGGPGKGSSAGKLANGKSTPSAMPVRSLAEMNIDLVKAMPLTHPTGKGACNLSFTADGKMLLVTTYRPGTVRVWHLANGRSVKTTDYPDGNAAAWAGAISPDGRYLASGGEDKLVRLFDVATRQAKAIFRDHDGLIRAVAFSPDSRTLASGSEDCTVRLWDVATGKAGAVFNERGQEWAGVYALSFSPNGKTLAAALADGTVRLHDLASQQTRAILRGHTEKVRWAEFSRDGRLIATASDKEVLVWNAATGKERYRLAKNKGPIAFTPDSAILAVASGKTLRLFDAANGRAGGKVQGELTGMAALTFSPDYRFLAVGGWSTVLLIELSEPRRN